MAKSSQRTMARQDGAKSTLRSPGFSEVTSLVPDGPGRFSAGVDPGWTVAGKPNGGFLLAILGRAATQVGHHPDVVAASVHFLRAPDVGPVSVSVYVLHRGRSMSHVRACMNQGDRACVEALLTIGRLDGASGPHWQAGLPKPGVVSYEECIRLSPDPAVFPVPLMDHVDVRLEPETMGWTAGSPAGRGELRGWLTLPADESFDPVSLLFAVDAFPPATFDIAMSGWVPTFQLSAYVRAQPAPGPVRVLHRAQLIDGRRVDEDCFIWDRTGRLVAQSTQLAGIRLG